MSVELDKNQKETHILKPGNELRFEVAERSHVLLEVVEGHCELFGSELVENYTYSFHPGTQAAVYSFQGAKIKLTGNTEFAFVSNDTPMDAYFKFALSLEQLRIKASREKSDKPNSETTRKQLIPRVVVVGPCDTGKSTLCKYLTNFSVRCGRTPIFVDLDVGQNSISVPGTISALQVERPLDPTANNFLEREGTFTLHYGHTTPRENLDLYNALIERLSTIIECKRDSDPRAEIGGTIINTCGWGDGMKKENFNALTNILIAFQATIVVVMESERLYNDIKKACDDSIDFLKVVRLPKSLGVSQRSRETRQELRWNSFHEYFYGRLNLAETAKTLKNPNAIPKQLEFDYQPRLVFKKFNEINLLKVGAAFALDSVLPAGEHDEAELRVVKVPINNEILNHVFTLSYCDEDVSDHGKELSGADSLEFYETNVAGFVVATGIDYEREMVKFLAPTADRFPTKNMLMMENVVYVDRAIK